MDYIASVARLPGAGETVAATGLIRRFGGKGANQAVAGARQGARVSMLGCVGADAEGGAYRRRLRDEGIDASAVLTTARALTGTALIAVDASAENLIIVSPGANGQLTPGAIRAERRRFSSARIVLLQLEVPLPTVLESIRLANRLGVPVVLNPSPLRADFPWGRWHIDTLIVNEGEAEAIFGLKPPSLAAGSAGWDRGLRQRRIQRLIITRGHRSTLLAEPGACLEVPTLRVRPVDTVGAGDAFAGTFAARRAEGHELIRAVGYANCAGALATLKPGAQEAIPGRTATEHAFRRLNRLRPS
jgi:ribokinase